MSLQLQDGGQVVGGYGVGSPEATDAPVTVAVLVCELSFPVIAAPARIDPLPIEMVSADPSTACRFVPSVDQYVLNLPPTRATLR